MEISFIPKCLLKYLTPDISKQYEANVLISNIIIAVIFIAFKNSLMDFINAVPHFCLFHKITGFQCPFCGITRSLCELAEGNIILAVKLNASSIFVALFFLMQIPMRIVALAKSNTRNSINSVSKILSIIVVSAMILVWIVLILLNC